MTNTWKDDELYTLSGATIKEIIKRNLRSKDTEKIEECDIKKYMESCENCGFCKNLD